MITFTLESGKVLGSIEDTKITTRLRPDSYFKIHSKNYSLVKASMYWKQGKHITDVVVREV